MSYKDWFISNHFRNSVLKQAKVNRKKFEELSFRAVAETISDAIIIADQNSTIIYANPKALQIFNYSEDELLGQALPSIISSNDRNVYLNGVEQFLKTGESNLIGHTTELEILGKYSTIIPVELSLSTRKEENTVLFTGIIRDISKNKKSEEQLKESQHFIEEIVDVSPAIFAIYDLHQNQVVYINKGVKEVLGYTEEELQQMDGMIKIIIHPDDLKRITSNKTEFLKDGVTDSTIRIKHADGIYRWFSAKSTLFHKDKEGKPKQILVITFDITNQKALENRYRLFIEGVKDYALFMMDPKGNITSWNEGAKRLKGYSEEEIIGKNFSIFYPEEALKNDYPAFELKEAKNNGRFEDNGWRVRKDGSQFYANVLITPLYDEGNTLLGFSKITRDLTAKKKAEDEITQLNFELEQKVQDRTEQLTATIAELQKINVDLDNFIYASSHDLKAPINNIDGLINALKTNEYLANRPEEVNILLTMIDDSIDKFKRILLDLGEISRTRKGREESMEEIDMPEITKEVLSLIKDQIERSNTKIDVDLKATKLHFSRTNFRSIIYNLVSNAIKYRSPLRSPEIEIKTEIVDGSILLSVKDNGLGIDEKKKDQIFGMFQRLHSHVEGTGVGLYIVKRIIDNAGAKIEVESKVGVGSTFTIYFKG